MNRITFLASISLFVLCACSSSTSENSNPSGSLQGGSVPAVGSMFISDFYHVDAQGNKIASTEMSDTAVVLQTGMTFGGRTNVASIKNEDEGFGPKQIGYLQYDPSGDISTYHPATLFWTNGTDSIFRRPGWLTYPIASHGTTTQVSMSDTIIPQRGSTSAYEAQTMTYVGPETVTIGSESIAAVKFLRIGFSGNKAYDSVYQWVSPKLGYVVKTQPITLKEEASEVSVVTSYHLQ